jgi:RNA-directed DNA polymerase
MMNRRGKSDSAIVAERPTNKAGQPAEEPEERRAETEGNAVQQSTRRAQNRESVSQALDRIRQAARQRKKEKFTALLHHISPEHLEAAFFELKENAAPGVDGVTWRAYEESLDAKIPDLHSRLDKGAYRPFRPGPSTYPNRMVGNAHSRLPPLRTRSSNGRLSES